MVQSRGGTLSPEEAFVKPILLLNSGPVGGVLASRHLGNELNIQNIITSDMGGTSFDVSMIRNGDILVKSRAEVNGLLTGLTMVDIQAIGAGGGSIAWVDDRGMPRVGPHSAGSRPGPACYDRGGNEPTATDVAVALGIIDPHSFLGEEMILNKGKALGAIEEKLLSRLPNMTVTEAASAVYRLLVSTMSNAVRTVTVQKGYDPREFTMVAYGGAGGAYICEICKEVDISKIIVPSLASVYSAYGLLLSDDLRSYVHTTNWVSGQPFNEVNRLFDEMNTMGVESLTADGYNNEDITIIREVDMKFAGQIHEMTIQVPNRPLTDRDSAFLEEQFTSQYEALYGSGTAWEEAGIQMVNCRLTAVGHTKKPKLVSYEGERTDLNMELKGSREVFLPNKGNFQVVKVYDRTKLTAGMKINGPCIIDAPDATIFIPDYGSGSIDSHDNLCIILKNAAAVQDERYKAV